jgi:hypothetical protein
MFRMNRLRPGFDTLESAVLLSAGVARAARSPHVDTRPGVHLELNGTLHGNKTVLVVDARVSAPADSQVVAGTLSYFGPNEATEVAVGELPSLSNLTLELSNHAGSVQLTLAPSSTNHYQFKVSGGTGSYAAAYGSGSLVVTFRQSSNEYILRLTSANG